MTLKDWLQAAVALLVIGGALANVRVSMAMRERDQKEMEALEAEVSKLRESLQEARERLSGLEGSKK